MTDQTYCARVFDALAGQLYESYWFLVTEKVVEVRFVMPCTTAVTAFYSKAIQHLACLPQPADLIIWVAEKASSDLTLPRPFWDWTNSNGYGRILAFDEVLYYANYDITSHTFTLLDRASNQALVWTRNVTEQPEWTRSFPFRSLWFDWLRPQGFLFIHAGAVGLPDGRGVLLTGRGGSGKSTSTLACLDSSLLYAGDDFLAVHPATQRVYSLYNVAKLEAGQFARFPQLQPLVYNKATMLTEKGQVFMADHFPEKIINTLHIEAMLLPRFTGQPDTTLRVATTADGWRALVPSTVGLLHSTGDYAHAVADFARPLPTFWLETGTDLAQIPARIINLLQASL